MQIQEMLQKFQSSWNWKQIDQAQGSQDWFNLKLGVLSASNAYKIVAKEGTATRDGYLMELCAQVATREHAKLSAHALEWGKSFEEPARATFAFTYGKEIEEVPFVFKDDSWREGTSPDGIVFADEAGVEIKVPFNSVHHIDAILNDKLKPEWSWQVQYQMRCLDADKILFCSFDPRNMSTPLHIVEVGRDEKKQSTFDEKIPQFLHDYDMMLEKLGLKFGSQWEIES